MKNKKTAFFDAVVPLLMIPMAFCLAWIPMMSWNFGLHSVFPQVPKISYVQAFFLSLLAEFLVSRPKHEIKG